MRSNWHEEIGPMNNQVNRFVQRKHQDGPAGLFSGTEDGELLLAEHMLQTRKSD